MFFIHFGISLELSQQQQAIVYGPGYLGLLEVYPEYYNSCFSMKAEVAGNH